MKAIAAIESNSHYVSTNTTYNSNNNDAQYLVTTAVIAMMICTFTIVVKLFSIFYSQK